MCRKKVPQSRPIPQGKRRSQGVRGVSRSPPLLRGQVSHGRVRRLWSRRRDWKDLRPPPPQGILRDVPFPQSPITPVRVREGQGGGGGSHWPPPYLGGEGRKVPPPPRGTRKDLDKVPPIGPPRVAGRRGGRVGRGGSGNQTRPGVGQLDPTLIGQGKEGLTQSFHPRGSSTPGPSWGLPQ